MTQQRRLDMTDEFEAMGRSKLFTTFESREIMRRRMDFEGKINGTPYLQDFKDYIEYEKTVLNDLKSRRSMCEYDGNKGSLEHRIVSRIKRLYETALRKFPDFQLCLAFFNFCKLAKYVLSTSTIVEKMIKIYPENPSSWLIAAKWYAYDCSDPPKGIQIICKGLAIHNSNKVLYSEAIQLELLHTVGENCSKKSSSMEPMTEEETICDDKLQTFVKEMVNNVSDCTYFIQQLRRLEDYKFTIGAQNLIIAHLLNVYPHEVDVWHVLAQRELKGLFFHPGEELNSTSTKTKIIRCCEKYKEGLEQICTSKKAELWSLYLNCLIEQCQDDYGVSNVFKKNALVSAHEQAYTEGCLLEKHFMSWLHYADDILSGEILKKATTVYPDSLHLWQLRLKHEIINGDVNGVETIFQAAMKQIKHTSIELWNARLKYHLCTSTDDILEKVYQEGIKQPKEVSHVLKPRYLEWLTFAKGIESARVQYLEIADEEPYCKMLHSTMARLEGNELECDYEAWEQVHKIACRQFGKSDVDVWINYADFHCRSKKQNSEESRRNVYYEAKSNLSEVLFLVFKDAQPDIKL